MNVKEKDLVQKALGLADSVGSKVSEMEGTLADVDNSLITGFDYGKFIHGSYSVEGGQTNLNVLNVTGSGFLYAATVSSGEYLERGEKYAKITLDNFSFYLDCSENGPDDNTLGVDYFGVMCPVNCLRYTRGMFTPGYYWRAYFDIFNKRLTSNGRFMSYNEVIFLPTEATDTPRRYILPPKPLAFDSGLKIDAFTASAHSDKLDIEVWYFLR